MEVIFTGGGNQGTQRKPMTCSLYTLSWTVNFTLDPLLDSQFDIRLPSWTVNFTLDPLLESQFDIRLPSWTVNFTLDPLLDSRLERSTLIPEMHCAHKIRCLHYYLHKPQSL